MKRDILRFSQGKYDLLVIGGGINGAAIAHLAARRGLKTALIEQGDFASGTSSKSTKLIHGGLRYLENLEFSLVKEALRERSIQLQQAPHLVKPLPIVLPVYQHGPRPLWLMRAGVALYDVLSGTSIIEKHRRLSVDEILEMIPNIKREGLSGGLMYYDAQMDDARLCLENVLMADQYGAHVANYIEAKTVMKEMGKAVGVQAYDSLSSQTIEIHADKIVSAVGPWTDQFLRKESSRAPAKVRTTKGVHVVYRGKLTPYALIASTHQDRRVFFLIPWFGNTLIGTTDTDYNGDPSRMEVDARDLLYLEKETQRLFPDASFKPENIVTSFAGLRPLVAHEGNPSKLSRRHRIESSYSGIVYVMGGKYTTYRQIAEETLKHLTNRNPKKSSGDFSLYGSGKISESNEQIEREFEVDQRTIESLKAKYGVRYRDVLELILDEPSLKRNICACSLTLRAQVLYALKSEMACHFDDIYARRLSLCYSACESKNCRKEIQDMISAYYN